MCLRTHLDPFPQIVQRRCLEIFPSPLGCTSPVEMTFHRTEKFGTSTTRAVGHDCVPRSAIWNGHQAAIIAKRSDREDDGAGSELAGDCAGRGPKLPNCVFRQRQEVSRILQGSTRYQIEVSFVLMLKVQCQRRSNCGKVHGIKAKLGGTSPTQPPVDPLIESAVKRQSRFANARTHRIGEGPAEHVQHDVTVQVHLLAIECDCHPYRGRFTPGGSCVRGQSS